MLSISTIFLFYLIAYLDHIIGWSILVLGQYLYWVPVWAKECRNRRLDSMPSYYTWAELFGVAGTGLGMMYLIMLEDWLS